MLAHIQMNDPCMVAMADVSQNVVPSSEGLGQWVNSTKTAEPINVKMEGLLMRAQGTVY